MPKTDQNQQASSSTDIDPYEQTYPQARAIEDAQWFAVTLTGDMQFLHNIGDESSLTKTFARAIRDYKDGKDGTHNNRNKPISDLLWGVLDKLANILKTFDMQPASYKFHTVEQAASRVRAMHSSNPEVIASPIDNPEHAQGVALKNTTVAPKVGMAFVYKLIAIIMAVLHAESKTDKLNRSEFVKAMLLNLQSILLSRQPQKTKGEETGELILEILHYFEGFALNFAYYADMRLVKPREKNRDHRHFVQALLKLVQYIIDKQTDKRHNVAKTEKAKQILLQLCEDETPENFKELFKLICEGIQLSRSEGKNGEKSRDLEYALIELRDYLVRRLFSSNASYDASSENFFDQKQLEEILASISYLDIEATTERVIRGPKKVVDADVSPYTLLVIKSLAKTLGTKATALLQIEHCQRLITQVPQVVNNSAKIDSAAYLFKSGNSWPRLMTQLLQSNSIALDKHEELQLYALIWNYRMVQYNESTQSLDINYLVPVSLLGKVKTHRDSAGFPLDLQKLGESQLNAMFFEIQDLYGSFDLLAYQVGKVDSNDNDAATTLGLGQSDSRLRFHSSPRPIPGAHAASASSSTAVAVSRLPSDDDDNSTRSYGSAGTSPPAKS
jgi:hypothetical protein